MKLLAINSGSSSLKFKVVEVDERSSAAGHWPAQIGEEGAVEKIGSAAGLVLCREGRTLLQEERPMATHVDAVR